MPRDGWKLIMRALLPLTCLAFAFQGLAAAAESHSLLNYPSIWQCDTKKPLWYCDDNPAPPAPLVSPPPADPRTIDPRSLKTAEEYRKLLQELKDLSSWDPSQENVTKYMEAQLVSFEKGAAFSDVWRRVVWQNPDLDYSTKGRPTNSAALSIYDQRRDGAESGQLKALAKVHGLIFMFRSNCPYCHRMAPTLRAMSERYGIEILPVSMDGGSLPDFPSPIRDAGQSAALGVKVVPALFIASRESGEIAPVSFGLVSEDEIVKRIFVLTKTEPGQNY